MTPEDFRPALKSDRRLYGTLLVSTSPFWPKVIGDCGLDFVFIDTEHIAIGRETLSWMCRTYAALGLPPLVRITDPDPHKATVAYDDGAAAVVAPYIETPEQVRALVGASKLREPLSPAFAAYVSKNTLGNSLIINIESVPAIERLDALLDVEGIDAVLIGPHDLSCSLGIAEQYQHPKFLKAAETIFRKARAKGIGAGIHFWGTEDEHVRLLNMGANILIHKADIILFRIHLRAELASIRARVGDQTANQKGGAVSI